MQLTYTHTKLACYAAMFVQAIVINMAPLLFVTFHASYGIPLRQIGLLVAVNFGVQGKHGEHFPCALSQSLPTTTFPRSSVAALLGNGVGVWPDATRTPPTYASTSTPPGLSAPMTV